jgi:Fe-S-cluster-containing dehydrogenase component
MYFGDLDDPNSEVSKLLQSRKWNVNLPDAGTQPNIFYLV